MSDHEIEYCPWCGGSVKHTMKQLNGTAVQAKECKDCETMFRVEVPHTESRIKWTTAR